MNGWPQTLPYCFMVFPVVFAEAGDPFEKSFKCLYDRFRRGLTKFRMSAMRAAFAAFRAETKRRLWAVLTTDRTA